MKNITYLFGAGASYNACPIWKEQAEKMIELPKFLGKNFSYKSFEYKSLEPEDKILWLIGYIGKKAEEFNTVDTYAKKLYLQNNIEELSKLKIAVSCFFIIWTLSKKNKWKTRLNSNNILTDFDIIDPRYINLLATYLEKGIKKPQLRKDIKFVTWNYDLQLINAYLKFADLEENPYWSANEYIPYLPSNNETNLKICHLNGFQGFYNLEETNKNRNTYNVFSEIKRRDIQSILSFLSPLIAKYENNSLSFDNHINYAWETTSELSVNTRNFAKKIFSNTDTLIIVGYSFPPFNYEIDKSLFESGKERINRIIIQDPRGDAKFVAETFDIPLKKISIVTSTDQFVIPNYAEKKVAISG